MPDHVVKGACLLKSPLHLPSHFAQMWTGITILCLYHPFHPNTGVTLILSSSEDHRKALVAEKYIGHEESFWEEPGRFTPDPFLNFTVELTGRDSAC